MTEQQVTIDRLVKVYTKIRDERARRSAEHDKADADLKGQMERVEAELLRVFNALGENIKNIRTEFGTAYRDVEIFPSVEDWDAFWQWMKANDALDAMERRIKRTFIKDYMEQHGGAPPPSVQVRAEARIRVRAK